MKNLKKVSVFLLVVLMLAVSVVPTFAANRYTAVAVSSMNGGAGITTLGLQEKVEVTEASAVLPNVTYSLKINSDITAYTNGGVTYGNTASVSSPLTNGTAIASVTYTAGSVTSTSPDAEKIKDYVYAPGFLTALNAMSFTEPGIYFWKIDKAITCADARMTNNNRSSVAPDGTSLLVFVNDVSGVLKVTNVAVAVLDSAGLPNGSKATLYEDNFPASPGTLSLKKEVTGNQGAKDQYFKFTVELKGMASIAGHALELDVTNGNGVASEAVTKYGETFTPGTTTNVQTVTVAADGTATATFWLKDQEVIRIKGLPTLAGVQYKITEDAATKVGYATTFAITGPATPVSGTADTTDWQNLTITASGDRVVFRNDKATSTPTGVLLQAGAPLAGLLLAGALFTVVLVTKRKKGGSTAR